MVAARLARLADLAQHLVLVRRGRVGQVRQRRQHGGAALLDRAQLLLELLLALREPARLGDRLGGVLAAPLQLADPLARLVLARAQLLELGQQRAAALVELERLVEQRRVDAAARQRVPRGLRVLADLPEVEHRDLAWRLAAGLCVPEYLSRKSATASASSPVTMFAGMIAPEKPPLRIAKSASSSAHLALTLKFGPLVRSPPWSWPSGFEP